MQYLPVRLSKNDVQSIPKFAPGTYQMCATLYSPTHIFGHFPPTRVYADFESDTVYMCMKSDSSVSPPRGQIKHGQRTNHKPCPLRHVSQFDNYYNGSTSTLNRYARRHVHA